MKDKHEKEETKSSEPVKIDLKDGLNVRYDKEDLRKNYPHLMEEIENEDKLLHNNSGISEIEKNDEPGDVEKKEPRIPGELINPGVNDFIRRCKTENEAIEILDYLLKRKEIPQIQYEDYKVRINKENGLKALIEKCGGFKKPGYYEQKYYKKNPSNM